MSTYIRSLHNPRIKQAAHLRDRRGRRRLGRIIVNGVREVSRALESGIEPLEVFLCDSQLEEPALCDLVERLRGKDIASTLVTAQVFEKIAFGHRSAGVVMIAAEPLKQLEQIDLPSNALVCVLEHVEKPGNLGAIVRTADAAGVAAVIAADGGTDLYNPNAIRASLGAVFRVPVCAASAGDVRRWLSAHQVAVFAARIDGAVPFASADYRGRSAFVLGSEAEGLSTTWCDDDITSVALPMLGSVDSLNVSATAAVLFYEALRQRQSS